MDCLFCKIVAGEIPAERVYENDHVIAILDIKPVNPGHVLIIPRKHSDGLHDADPATLDATIRAAQKIAQALLTSGLAQAFNLEQNNGELAGQVIPHLHLHVVPRRAGDGLKHWPGTPYSSESEAKEVAEKVRANLVSS
jgi:histidine triad (HIT) family protein